MTGLAANALALDELEQLKQFIVENLPNHIRQYQDGWYYEASGVVWYDPHGKCDTRDEAIAGMLEQWQKDQGMGIKPKDRRDKIDIELQELRAKLEAEKLEVLKLKAAGKKRT